MGRSATLRVGQFCLALGNPFGYDRSLTTGARATSCTDPVHPVSGSTSSALLLVEQEHQHSHQSQQPPGWQAGWLPVCSSPQASAQALDTVSMGCAGGRTRQANI